ncbi:MULTISPECIES: ATP-binding protein [unclassified Bradyrhizobium]|uniref:ATP-binding protein n=1 Tax=unclassified Bradyrhizobium TaxID=2631580 RepID=UPI0028E522D4|nr:MULTISPECIES: ATP-binding protein [unclassified Bradyrhizobium]
MKLGMQDHVDVASGVQSEIKVTFDMNAVAFYAQMSGLAKDKIGYPIREISTNAWDASRGNYEVHLPTGLNPVFRVRDFGPGMTPEQMQEVYAKMYASTKRESNNDVGGWGLGRFSPFAYLIGESGAGSYNVVSYTGGMMRAYVMSLAAGGFPVLRLLAEVPSDEPSGLDVSFPVRREDVHAFNNRASQILWSFNPRPRITPAPQWNEAEVSSSGEGWTWYKDHTVPFYGPQVRMGCVMYPIDLRQIETTGFLHHDDTVLFDAPIGSLKVTLSREELAYDENTKGTLKNLVASFEQNFINQVRRKVDAAKTLFEACKVFETEQEELGMTRLEKLRNLIEWNGRRLHQHILKQDFKTAKLGNDWRTFDKFEDVEVRSSWAADATVVIEHNPNYSFSRFMMAELVGKKVLWVRCKRINRDATLARLGNPENVVDLDSFKVPVEKRRGKTVRKRRTLVVSASGLTKMTQDVDLADGGEYIEESTAGYGRRRRHDSWFYVNGRTISLYDLDSVVADCVRLGILEVGQMFLIKGQDAVTPDNWSEMDIVSDLKAKVDPTHLTEKDNRTSLDSNLSVWAKSRQIERMPDDVQAFWSKLHQVQSSLSRRGARETTPSDIAHGALKKLGISVEIKRADDPVVVVEREYAELGQKYPLLRSIINRSGYYSFDGETYRQLTHYLGLLVDSQEFRKLAPAKDEKVTVEDDEDADLYDDLDEDLDEAA